MTTPSPHRVMVITVECPSCSSSFPVDTAKVPEAGVHARCSDCSGIFFVAPVEEPAEAPHWTRVDRPGAPAAPDAPPHAPAAREEPDPGAWEIEPFVAPEIPEAGEPAQASAPEEPEAPLAFEDLRQPGGGPEATTFEEVEEPAPEVTYAEEPAYTEPPVDFDFGLTLDAPPQAEPTPEPLPTFEPEPIPEAEAKPEPEPTPEPPAAPAPSAPSAPAPTFTFGRRDPHEKARRLARVLVSDMIMYNPERHSRAISSGSLREDFEDEIKKSWEEYTEQVGDEIANSTSYFHDALNEILARGEHLFP